ncbi:hypothetical protein QFC22_000982 [Naganishia vaughanmartiniae]|uniref:Uncharacterized protein n=1 Tax=Naganishia vaughanmartiniae TaxID=1424756 RepID=A0ACC2XLC3_9TREE|nr:hypothetical protein QFC22_000982 [Naganishia vaughanmartiniae]
MDHKQISLLSTPTSTEAIPPPSYDDSLQTPWQGTSSNTRLEPSPSARQPLESAKYSLYTTTVPDNAEQPTYDERLVAGVEMKVSSSGDIVTHSPILHDRTHLHQKHTHDLTRSDSDLAAGRNRSQNDIVVDFDFQIDLSSILESTIDLRTLTTVRPDRAVPRGTHHSTFHPEYRPYGSHYRPNRFFGAIDSWTRRNSGPQSEDAKSLATKPGIRPVQQERKLLKTYILDRHGQGLPPWAPWPESLVQAIQGVRDQVRKVSEAKHARSIRSRAGGGATDSVEYSRIGQLEDGQIDEVVLDHATLGQWCQEFCASRQPLKEIRLHKHLYGWEWNSLNVAIRAAIGSTDYQGNVEVKFVQGRSLVVVHPDNTMTRWLTKTWVIVLLWITLIYPFVWLYLITISISKRLIAGGVWTTARAHYPVKCYAPHDPSSADDSPEYGREIRLGPTYQDAKGQDSQLYEMKGYKEGRFMKRWEGRIKDAVIRQVGANGRSEILGDVLLAERQDAAGRQVTRALDGYESG